MLGTIQSARLSLRDVMLDDAPAFFELDRDPEVMRFLGGVRAEWSVADVRALLAERIAWYASCPGLGLGACFLSANGEFIGWFMLRPRKYRPYDDDGALLEPTEDAELGYRLARRFWARATRRRCRGRWCATGSSSSRYGRSSRSSTPSTSPPSVCCRRRAFLAGAGRATRQKT